MKYLILSYMVSIVFHFMKAFWLESWLKKPRIQISAYDFEVYWKACVLNNFVKALIVD